MAGAFFQPAARRDLFEIADYIDSDRPGRGMAFAQEIETACKLWAGMPLAGRTRDEISPGLRSFPVGQYIVFYRPIDDGILIIRVLHGMRDLKTLL
ncbi:MAG: type II toxin-antitoxin system RelE/ParE family toxin [Alphaproteobacteria bacterium]|nr:type II toxin-antitoxin system RelE/ParE family toxin [Alphaproteobacteria bacterium]